MHLLLEMLSHAITETVRLIPFLYITYLIMEFLEHKAAHKMQTMIGNVGRLGPVLGALLGVVPQCGFSAAAASLYAGRVISLGTLIAVFLSTSDEMLPILLANRNIGLGLIGKILCFKILIGIIAGFLCDAVFSRPKSVSASEGIHALCEHDHCHCSSSKNIFISALVHTSKIIIFLFGISFLLNAALHGIGEDVLASILLNRPFISQLIAGLIGLIPNCASSVVLTQLYAEGALSFSACMTGLLTGSGVGILVLFRTNHSLKENMKILVLLYALGLIAGFAAAYI